MRQLSVPLSSSRLGLKIPGPHSGIPPTVDRTVERPPHHHQSPSSTHFDAYIGSAAHSTKRNATLFIQQRKIETHRHRARLALVLHHHLHRYWSRLTITGAPLHSRQSTSNPPLPNYLAWRAEHSLCLFLLLLYQYHGGHTWS